MNKTHIIIGASAAGIAAAQKLRQLDAQSTIVMISDEQEAPYNKCMLADYMAGIKHEHQVYTLSLEQAAQKNITLMRGKQVTAIAPDVKKITLDDGQAMAYDTLLLAVGTSPFIPPIAGIDAQGVFTFHRLRDIHAIMAYVKRNAVKKAVVIGAGLSGMECADALRAHGVAVSVVERQSHVLASIVTQEGSAFIQERMKQHEVQLYPQSTVEQIMQQDGVVHSVHLKSGQMLQTEMVIIAAGLAPNTELAEQAGIALGSSGILINEYMQTSVPGIYAAGDIVMVKDQLSGSLVPSRLWPDAMMQGTLAASAMAGNPRLYPGVASIISSAFFGIKFVACGPILTPKSGMERVINKGEGFYHMVLVQEGKLKGFLLVGNTSKSGLLRQAVMTQMQLSAEMLA